MADKPRADTTSLNDPDSVSAADHQGMAIRLIPVAVPAVLLIGSLLLPSFMFSSDRRPDVPGLGPAAWPRMVLILLGLCSAIWLLSEMRVLLKGRFSRSLAAPHDEDVYHYGKAVIGIGLTILFGWALPYVGFPIACSAFLLIWCLYGGIRNPLTLFLVPTIGTVGLLWMFMGLALMPLSRGVGMFDRFSVGLLQILGIY